MGHGFVQKILKIQETTNLVHAAGELLIVIIDLGLGFVPDDRGPHVQHLD